jgi:hypothetical protein
MVMESHPELFKNKLPLGGAQPDRRGLGKGKYKDKDGGDKNDKEQICVPIRMIKKFRYLDILTKFTLHATYMNESYYGMRVISRLNVETNNTINYGAQQRKLT